MFICFWYAIDCSFVFDLIPILSALTTSGDSLMTWQNEKKIQNWPSMTHFGDQKFILKP